MSEGTQPEAVVARYKPYYFKPVAGKTYLWCTCGRSARQPFCDGSHKGTGLEPLRYTAQEGQDEVLFCGCKQSGNAPFCDGAHNNLRDVYEEEDPNSEQNRSIPLQTHHRDGRYCLNGNTFVAKVARLETFTEDNIRWRAVITAAQGARHQAMFHVEVDRGSSPVLGFGERDVVLLAAAGGGELEIGGRRFELGPAAGLYVRPGETFRVHNAGGEPVSLYVAVSPQSDAPVFVPAMTDRFDRSCPQRKVERDSSRAERMADRTFQLLVGAEIGSHEVTQFIGTIPVSMAARHRHLYEETLVVLSGRGAMWTEDMKAPVSPGDVIFLPSKQAHSLQCTDEAGMIVAGVIHPGGNPDINF